MERITITVEQEFLEALDRLIAAKGYQNRSEAIRDLARAGLRQAEEEQGGAGQCVAALVYAYDHNTRELSKRIANTFHDHHDLSLASLHVHLDHEACLEVAVLRGATGQVSALADRIIAERGVRHGKLMRIPVELDEEVHAHGAGRHRHVHAHVKRA